MITRRKGQNVETMIKGLPATTLLPSRRNRRQRTNTLPEDGCGSNSEKNESPIIFNELIESKQTYRKRLPRCRHFAAASLMTTKECQQSSSMRYWREGSETRNPKPTCVLDEVVVERDRSHQHSTYLSSSRNVFFGPGNP